MKKIKKSTGVAIAFLIYVSVTAAYLLPRNTEVGQTEKILTVVGSYVIVLLLWLVLRWAMLLHCHRISAQAFWSCF